MNHWGPSRNTLLWGSMAALLWWSMVFPAGAMNKNRGPRVLKHQGRSYISLKDMAFYYGLEGPKVTDDAIELKSVWTTIRFRPGSRIVFFNEVQLWMSSGSKKIKGKWHITQSELLKTFDPLLRPYAHMGLRGYKTVVLDAGHGGEDGGAQGPGGSLEKVMALDITRRVAAQLKAAGINVVMTRDTDKALELSDRPKLAAGAKADLFVSIHLNAGSATAEGAEVYALSLPGYPSSNDAGQAAVDPTPGPGNTYDPANMLLAYNIQKALRDNQGQEDRGVRRARFLVLKHAPCPAALVECGFLSNAVEEKDFENEAYRKDIANRIGKGILAYVDRVVKARLMGTPREAGGLPAKK